MLKEIIPRNTMFPKKRGTSTRTLETMPTPVLNLIGSMGLEVPAIVCVSDSVSERESLSE